MDVIHLQLYVFVNEAATGLAHRPNSMTPQQQQQQPAGSQDHRFVRSALSVYVTEVQKAIVSQQDQLQQLQDGHEELQQAISVVEQLPTKLRHDVMVPLGRHAFFPGHLVHTNELTVHLGAQYYAQVTATDAKGILQRKQAVVSDGISKAEQQLQSLQARISLSDSNFGAAQSVSEAREIRSSLEESDALLASAHKPAVAITGAATTKGQQKAQRVESKTGYSYSRPQGTAPTQRTPQQEAEDAELQARLEQLLLLEQEQEEQPLFHSASQAQQMQQLTGLDVIQEVPEDEEEGELDMGSAQIACATPSHGDANTVLDVVERLERMEVESDSDDDAHEQQQQQQRRRRQNHQPELVSQQAALQTRQQHQKPVKSILKKGFLGVLTPQSSTNSSNEHGRTSKLVTQLQAGSTAAASTGGTAKSTNAPADPDRQPGTEQPCIGAVIERTPVALGTTTALSHSTMPSSSSSSAALAVDGLGGSRSKPMSKFKMRRLGLEHQDD